MKRSLNIFFNRDDEKEFSELLKRNIADIKFVDGCYWDTAAPPTKDSIEECKDNFVYLWKPSAVNMLTPVKHVDGKRYHGPQSGVVIQFSRCRVIDNTLQNGSISAGISDSQSSEDISMRTFVNEVWSLINKFTVRGLVCVSPGTGELLNEDVRQFRLGPNAAEWSINNPACYFRDRTVSNYYRARK